MNSSVTRNAWLARWKARNARHRRAAARADQPAPALFFECLDTDELDDVGVGGTGTVTWCSDDKGFGFITPDEPGKDRPRGNPPAVTLTAGPGNDITQLLPLLDAVGPLADKVGRSRQRPNRDRRQWFMTTTRTAARVWPRGVKPSSACGDRSHSEAAALGAGTDGMVVLEVGQR